MKYFVTIEFYEEKVGWIVYPFPNKNSAIDFVNDKFSKYQDFRYDIDTLPEHLIKDYFFYKFSGDEYFIGNTLNYSIITQTTDGQLSMTVIKSCLPFNPSHYVVERSQEAIFMIERN